jgi:hypothetical protein
MVGPLIAPVGNRIKGVILDYTPYTNPLRMILYSRLLTAIQKPVLVLICWLLIVLPPLIRISRWLSYFNGNSYLMSRGLTFTGTQSFSFQQLNFVSLLSTLALSAITATGVLGMLVYDASELPT